MKLHRLVFLPCTALLLAVQTPGAPSLGVLPSGDHATGVQATQQQQEARAVSEQLYVNLPADLMITRDVIYSDAESQFRRLDVIQTRDRNGPEPVILKLHGGGLTGGDKSWHRDVMALWARQGFSVVTANYRMSPEYTWPAMIEDADAALRWIGANAEAHGFDASQVFVTGDSAGAYLAVSLATMATELFPPGEAPRLPVRGAAGWYGAYTFVPRPGIEWTGWGTSSTWPVMPSGRDEDSALWELASPINHIDPSDAPILLIHGIHDTIIPFSQSLVFAEKAWQAGASVELRLIPSMEHSFRPSPPEDMNLPAQRDSLMRAAQDTLEFFQWHLDVETAR